MKSRVVRISLFLLAVIGFAGGGYEIFLLEQQAAATRQAGVRFDDNARRAEAMLAELRAAQFAYFAPDQGVGYWTGRATTLIDSIGRDLKALQQSTPATDVRSWLASASETLTTVQQLDRNVQNYLRDDQRQLASGLVFADLRQANERVSALIGQARRQQAATSQWGIESVRRMQSATAAGAAIFAVLVLLLLVPSGAARKERLQPATGRGLQLNDQPQARPSRALSTGGPSILGDEAADGPRQTTAGPAPTEAGRGQAPSPARTSPSPDVAAAAALCTDFARVRETAQFPPLLERVARLLDAVGVVVWIDDSSTGQLRPAIWHGYSSQALARMQGISTSADNATASAYRDGALQVVEADGTGNGAIVTPLVTPDGCVGVMAAELRGGRERDRNTQALATIVAAQMATLIAPSAGATPGGANI